MYEFIQALPNNPYFVLALISIAGLLWFGMPQTKWYKKHITDTFNNHPACFMCNEGGEICYKIMSRCKAMREDFETLDEIYKD